jgi:hypothetical protein
MPCIAQAARLSDRDHPFHVITWALSRIRTTLPRNYPNKQPHPGRITNGSAAIHEHWVSGISFPIEISLIGVSSVPVTPRS